MSEYKNYTIEIILKSSLVTPLQSDTLFGHICWAIRFLNWDNNDKLAEFLRLFDVEGHKPPILVSNGFPKNYLPKPILPPVTQDELDSLVEKEDRIKESFKIKVIKKTDIIRKDLFTDIQKQRLNHYKLFCAMYDKEIYKSIEQYKAKVQNAVVQHNTIDRIKGSVKEGSLYSQEETFFDDDSGIFEIYIKTNYFSSNELEKIFKYISTEGFGRDKSTGKGHFTFEVKEGIDLPEAEKPNAFMTLSSYIPKENDPTKGYYNIIHKFGKLGGLYAKGVSEVNNNPFKVPLIMFAAGSIFYDEEYKQDKVYGSLLRKVHHNEDIRHYAYAFPLGIYIEDNNEDL